MSPWNEHTGTTCMQLQLFVHLTQLNSTPLLLRPFNQVPLGPPTFHSLGSRLHLAGQARAQLLCSMAPLLAHKRRAVVSCSLARTIISMITIRRQPDLDDNMDKRPAQTSMSTTLRPSTMLPLSAQSTRFGLMEEWAAFSSRALCDI